MKKNKYHQKLKTKAFEGVKNKIFSIVVIVAFFFVGMYGYRCLFEKVCGMDTVNKIVRKEIIITTPHGEINAEVVDTKSGRELGLSGRSTMKDNDGLLFIFDTPGRYAFWMKDMAFPLDIIWINKDGVIVEIERNAKPESYPKTYMNTFPATYVLEVNAGIAEKQGLFIGSKVKIIE